MDPGNLDPVWAVLGALAAGAGQGVVEGVKESSKAAVTKSRERLVSLVRGRLRGDELGSAKLTVYAADPSPETARSLQGHLVEAGVAEDAEITDLAREILAAVGRSATGPGSVAAQVINQFIQDHAKGFVGGQHVHNYSSPGREPVAVWDLQPIGPARYELRNIGPVPAMEVEITSEVDLGWPSSRPRTIPAGSGVAFIWERRQHEPSTPVVTVSWSSPGSAERHQWQRPIPN